MSNIIETLKKFNPAVAELWTDDGLPRLDVLAQALGHEITREQLEQVAPGFSRATAEAFGQEQAADVAGSGQAPAEPSIPDAPTAVTHDDHSERLEEAVPEVVNTQSVQAALNAEIGEAMQAVADAEARLARAQEAAAAANEAAVVDFATNNARYQAAQHQARLERAQLAATVAESGVNLGALSRAIQGAPVDVHRMNMRPVFPQLKKAE